MIKVYWKDMQSTPATGEYLWESYFTCSIALRGIADDK